METVFLFVVRLRKYQVKPNYFWFTPDCSAPIADRNHFSDKIDKSDQNICLFVSARNNRKNVFNEVKSLVANRMSPRITPNKFVSREYCRLSNSVK